MLAVMAVISVVNIVNKGFPAVKRYFPTVDLNCIPTFGVIIATEPLLSSL